MNQMLWAFSVFILFLCVAVLIFVFVELGPLPGKIAKEREHPQADAIMACGWAGAVAVLLYWQWGIFWIVALIWAHTKRTTALGEGG
jgi:hypothetical protein